MYAALEMAFNEVAASSVVTTTCLVHPPRSSHPPHRQHRRPFSVDTHSAMNEFASVEDPVYPGSDNDNAGVPSGFWDVWGHGT